MRRNKEDIEIGVYNPTVFLLLQKSTSPYTGEAGEKLRNCAAKSWLPCVKGAVSFAD